MILSPISGSADTKPGRWDLTMGDNVQKATDFAKMARADLEACMESSIPYSICFYAQQSTEKYLKAFLAFHGRTVPKSHDIEHLIKCCAKIDPLFNSLLMHTDALQPFGVEIRYAPSKEEAEQKCPTAWAAMTAVFELLKQSLPEEIAMIVSGH